MATAKKQKLVDLTTEDKKKVRKTALVTFTAVAMMRLILVSCLACTQNQGMPEMTEEQKTAYWTAQIMDVTWAPMTDATHDGILRDLYAPRDVRTDLDASGLVAYFLFEDGTEMTSARLMLAGENGMLVFESSDTWTVKFSEKNSVLYMTITDSDSKVVYYQNK